MIFQKRRRENERIRAELPALTGLLNGQRLAPLSQIPFGCSTVGLSGCETIAIHNLLVCLGRPRTYQAVLSVIESDCWLFGWFGISPRRIRKALFRLGVSSRRTADRDALTSAVAAGIPILVSYWTKRRFFSPIHTVCVYPCATAVYLLNHKSRQATAEQTEQLPRWLSDRRLIIGYIPDKCKGETYYG